MFQLALILAATVALGVHGQTQNYSLICSNQTMAKNSIRGSNNCSQLITSGVSAADIKIIVDTLNALRSRVAKGLETRGRPGPQPPAANMRALAWDKDLAAVAQRWADQCPNPPSTDKRFNVSSIPLVGQNILLEDSPTNAGSMKNWTGALNRWFDEVKMFNKNYVNLFRSQPKTLEYAQIVWADTYLVGCGFSECNRPNKETTLVYVCNFNPGGDKLYRVGTACSQCPTNTTCSAAEGLCA